MAKRPSDRFDNRERVPDAPAPSAATARDAMESTRERARRYLPDALDLLAGLAFAAESAAALHTKFLAAKEIVALAGALPQPTPAPPQHDADGVSSEPS